jgi:predicted RNA-binding Zn ribbon-like protein
MAGEATIPDPVRTVRDFVNTAEPQTGGEQFTNPGELRSWLASHELLAPSAALTAADLQRALAIREGLRVALQAHAGHPVDAAALEPLHTALDRTPLRLRFAAAGRRRLDPAADDPLGGLVAVLARASECDGWDRLKVCASESCRWAYYDSSRNRSGRWCSMAGCGNQVKMRRAYAARKRGRDAPSPR